jgi:hypothetical protein
MSTDEMEGNPKDSFKEIFHNLHNLPMCFILLAQEAMEVSILLNRIRPAVGRSDFVETDSCRLIQSQPITELTQPPGVHSDLLQPVANLLRSEFPGLPTGLEQAIDRCGNFLT